MLKIYKENNLLLAEYDAYNPIDWLNEALFVRDKEIKGKYVFPFRFRREDLFGDIDTYNNTAKFIIGNFQDNYWKIKTECLHIDYDLFLSDDVNISYKTFVTDTGYSVFNKIFEVINKSLWIGGTHENNLSIDVFDALKQKLPSRTEIHHYIESKISYILKEYFDDVKDFEQRYEKYMNKKQERLENIQNQKKLNKPLNKIYAQNEIDKYEDILNTMTNMLKNPNVYSEKEWQKKMTDILLLIFPKYVAIIENVSIKNVYSEHYKFLDFLFVDVNGNTDIVEIKKPFDNCILRDNKYRDNYIPRTELSGAVMQVEKYIYYMNKWGIQGEKTLQEKYGSLLPPNLKIHITNPKGIVILGQSSNFSDEQKEDFEIIKRKYANIIDIISYNDLLDRIRRIIDKFQH